MYSGFSRLVSLREVKTNYLYVCYGQEILLHQVPLTLLFYYNNTKLEKDDQILDQAFIITTILHTTWVFMEMIVLRGYDNSGVNLERRIKHTADTRIKETLRLGLIALIIGSLFMIPAYVAFDK